MSSAANPQHNEPPTRDEGPRAAWLYLRLACYALFGPVWARFRPRSHALLHWMDSRAGHMYLLLNAGLYGYAALAFLASIPGLTAGRTGLAAMDDDLLHAAWGLCALAVCLSQIAALWSVRVHRYEWAIWRLSAILTTMWATAYWAIVILVSFAAHSYGGILIWGWVVGIHLIMVRNHPVPQEVPASETPRVAHLSPREEANLLTRLHQFADNDEPAGEHTRERQ